MRAMAMTLILLASSLSYGFSVRCNGYNSITGAPVSGSCNFNRFTGHDSRTGNTVTGFCRPGSSFTAYDSRTGERVSGTCFPELPIDDGTEYPAEYLDEAE